MNIDELYQLLDNINDIAIENRERDREIVFYTFIITFNNFHGVMITEFTKNREPIFAKSQLVKYQHLFTEKVILRLEEELIKLL